MVTSSVDLLQPGGGAKGAATKKPFLHVTVPIIRINVSPPTTKQPGKTKVEVAVRKASDLDKTAARDSTAAALQG
jgi:hypothetical protein